MRCHAPAKGLTTGQQRHTGILFPRVVYDTRNRLYGQWRLVRQLAPLFHVGKVIPHRTDTVVCQRTRQRLHKAVEHAGPGAVAKDQEGNHVRWDNGPHRNSTGTG